MYRNTVLAPANLIESPSAAYASSQNNIRGFERIDNDLIRANQQLPQMQPMARNIPTNKQELPCYSIVAHPEQVQHSYSDDSGISVLPYSGTLYFTLTASLAGGPENNSNSPTQPSFQQMSYSSADPTFSLGSRNQSEQQPGDFSLRSTNSNASSTIGATPENRQARPGPNVSASHPRTKTNSSATSTTKFGACQVCTEQESNTILIPCGEVVLCEKCAESCTYCPHCRSRILRRIRVYLA